MYGNITIIFGLTLKCSIGGACVESQNLVETCCRFYYLIGYFIKCILTIREAAVDVMKLNITNMLEVYRGSCKTLLYVYRHTKVPGG